MSKEQAIMFDPVVQANDSPLLNGDFIQGMDNWTRGANPREVAVVGEVYDGVPIKLLSAGNLGSAWQQVTVPVKPDARARYVLSFLYETRHAEAGQMLITAEDGTVLREISLPPASPRELAEDQASVASRPPLVFEPIEYNAPFDLPLQRLDKIRVTVVAPANADPDDYHLKVLITRIHLALHLEPVVLQTLKLDEEQLPASGLLYLCLGADGGFQHRLECVPEPDSPWLYTKAALISDDNPQGAVTAAPDWGVDHPLDSSWVLQCPLIDDGQDPYLFTVNLVNQYTAAPYPIRASLGHHRLVFSEELEAAYYPVLELAQSVRLGVRVASWYTGQFLAGRTVTWAIDGQGVLGTTSTDSEGWAYFDFLPTTAGDVAIKASVTSPYYASGVETTTLDVRVLATDPWKEVLAVVEGNALPWAQTTGYPNRGSTYQVSVRLPEVLRGTELAMRWEGDSAAQLGVQVRPELEQSRPVDVADLDWALICQDELDGRFLLQLSCSKLLLPSDRKPMSLARNLVRIGDVQEANKFPVVDEHESVLLRVQVMHVVTSGDGDPVNNALVDWLTPEGTISTQSGSGGWANVLYQPSRGGDLMVTARVRAHADAVAIEHPFAVKALPSSPWKNQIRILFDNTEVDLAELGLLCWRGASHTLRIEATAGSSLLDQLVTLQWRGESPEIGLTVAGIGVPLKLESKGLEWTFSSQVASSSSSLFSLVLSSPVLASPRELFGRLIATDLMDELTVMLDQVTATIAGQTLFPCIGARHNVGYLPNALSPLVGLQGTLMWQGTPAGELDASVEPPLDISQTLSDGGIGWSLDFTASKDSGDFTLGLFLPALSLSMSANPMRLAHNKLRIGDWRESAVDAVIGRDKAWSWVRVVSAFTGQAVAQVAVQWKTAAGLETVASDDLGWSGFGLTPGTAGQQEVVANVRSPFDDYEEQRALSFIALARDPWEGVRVRFDGHDEQPWGSQTFFPRRRGTHILEVLFEDDSPLFEQDLALGLTGTGPVALGLRFEPALGVAHRPSALGMRFSVRCDDVTDGGFALRLGAERLARLSPANAMSLGVGAQVLKILANSRVQHVLEWEQELVEEVSVVSSITGKGIPGIAVTWHNAELGTLTSLTDFYGVARLRFKPQTPGAAVVTATVGDAVYSESVDLAYTLEEPREIIELYEPQGSRLPPDEEEAQAIAKVVSARTGLPLAGVQVRWGFAGNALVPSVTDEEGIARLTFRYPAGVEDVLSATVRGGLGGWDMAQLGYVGVVPEIDSLTSPDTNINLGQDATAEIRVVSRHDGRALAGVRIVWDYPQLSLPPTVTGQDGKSRIDFRPVETGQHDLKATVVLGGSRLLEFEVFDPATRPQMFELAKLHGQIGVGGEAHMRARVTNRSFIPIQGEEVFWSFPNTEIASTRTNADGYAEVKFILPARGTIVAKVRGGSNMSMPV
jgi:hypothetical protein